MLHQVAKPHKKRHAHPCRLNLLGDMEREMLEYLNEENQQMQHSFRKSRMRVMAVAKHLGSLIYRS